MLEKNINVNTQKRNQAVKDFEKYFNELLNNALYGNKTENIRNRIKVEVIKKDDNEKIVDQQSKLTITGIHISYPNYDSETFKQKGVLKDKPIYVEITVLELNEILIHETYFDKLQLYFGEKKMCNYTIWILIASW